MIGYFGDIIFETSDKKILNFTDMSREASSRFATHELIGQKPKDEFIGPGLDTISFTINLNASFGVNVRQELDKWIELVRNGMAHTLVVGGKKLGVDKWKIKSVSESFGTIFQQGQIYSGKINVNLEEYISTL